MIGHYAIGIYGDDAYALTQFQIFLWRKPFGRLLEERVGLREQGFRADLGLWEGVSPVLEGDGEGGGAVEDAVPMANLRFFL